MSGREFKLKKESPSVIRVKQFLDRSKAGELFTTNQVADALELNVKTVDLLTRFLGDYVQVSGHGVPRYYGKPVTIAELRRQSKKKEKR